MSHFSAAKLFSISTTKVTVNYSKILLKHEHKRMDHIHLMTNKHIQVCDTKNMGLNFLQCRTQQELNSSSSLLIRVSAVSAEAENLIFASETLSSVQTIRLCKQQSVGD